MLKILSRITEPTGGRVLLRGRVASLLEVGTGFHPELTGRENIFLNGAILGMTRRETPQEVRRDRSLRRGGQISRHAGEAILIGMYVRLAFAVAAHLEPEILIVDEVLAVGDYDFQKKCLGKMQDVASHDGRAVLLVSHNMAAISEMATRAVLLNAGQVEFDGEVSRAISTYLSRGAGNPVYERGPDQSTKRTSRKQGGGYHFRRKWNSSIWGST